MDKGKKAWPDTASPAQQNTFHTSSSVDDKIIFSNNYSIKWMTKMIIEDMQTMGISTDTF